MLLSDLAINKVEHVISAIKEHPFNKELMSGELKMNIFMGYIVQDTFYLESFSKALTLLAAKADKCYMKDFLLFALGSFEVESSGVHDYFYKQYPTYSEKRLTVSAVMYANYLISVTSLEAFALGVAAVLPCFWIYKIVGEYIKQNCNITDNPYSQWITTYSGDSFNQNVKRAITNI